MTAKLYFNKSDKRYVNKDLEAITYEGSDHIDIEFKDDTSVVNPTFILRTQSKVLTANYIYVPDLNRYYYINDYVVSHQRIFINCHVDVLMSYKSSLMSKNVIAKRSENRYNLYLPDDKFKMYNYPKVQTLTFTPTSSLQFDMDVSQYVLVTAGAISAVI